MRIVINENQIKSSEIKIPAEGLIPEVAAVRAIRPVYATDASGNRSDTVIGIRYSCVDPDTFSTFTLKTETVKPVISPEELAESESPVFISIPVEEVEIHPYAIEYGTAKLSITVPFVRLHTLD